MASGQFNGGNGSVTTPYLIEDAKDLNAIRFFPNKCFKLTQSINLGVYPYNTDKGWLPIANFSGTLDGDGHKIFNLYINRTDNNNVGLFSIIYKNNAIDLQIKNLFIDNANVSGNNNVGILAGAINILETSSVQSSYILENIKISGKLNGANQVGAVIGRLYWDGTLAWTPNLIRYGRTTVNISMKSSGTDYSGLMGYGNLLRGTINVSNFISDCSFDNTVNSITTTVNPNHWPRTDTTTITYKDTYFNKETWNYGTQAGLTLQQLSNKNLGELNKQLDDNNNFIWNFSLGKRIPELNLFIPKKHLIKTENGYYIYDFKENVWINKFTKIYTREQLFKNAMENIEQIPFSGWAKLKELLGTTTTFNLIEIVENSGGTTFVEKVLNMDLDTQHTTNTDKKLFSKKIQFIDTDGTKLFGDTIVQIDKGIIQ